MTKELSVKHPGFYRYNSVVNFNKYIDSVKSIITDSLSELEVYRKLKPIVSKIGCLHTDRPFRYWDRIEVTEAITNEIKGPAIILFYYKPVPKTVYGYGKKGNMLTTLIFMKCNSLLKIISKGKHTF